MKTNEKLGEILQLCLQLQASGWGDVFFDMSGHVSKVRITGYKGGHKSKEDPYFIFNSYYDGKLKDYEDDWTDTLSRVRFEIGRLIPNPEMP